MHRAPHHILLLAFALLLAVSSASAEVFPSFGVSWDGQSLQSILDDEYGTGAIEADRDYEGFLPGDADPAFWLDASLHTVLVREIAGYASANSMGWYEETLVGAPIIDGIDDGLIFSGLMTEGAERVVEFPNGETRFGFYLNPQGGGSSCNAPEPERFFTNRYYNDIGPNGSGALHSPEDGDIQCLIYNISHLRGGVPTFVLAWEDFDSGSTVATEYDECGTDNDYNDLVVEVSAFSPMKIESASWGSVKAMYEE